MKRVRWILVFVVLAFLLAGAWFFWARPKNMDMAAYAPGNALMYMETDAPLSVVRALMGTDAWKLFDKTGGSAWDTGHNSWTRQLVRITGIGPIQSVILSRAQIAIVVTDIGTIEEGLTLRVKPQLALLIETHTPESRIRSTFELALKKLAELTYDKPALRRTVINGVEFVEWRSQEGSRQIVSAIVGSLVVVGNSEAAVQQVLDSASGRSPNLKDDKNLHRLRREFAASQSLTFGYVPEEKSAQLLSFAVPLILGRPPGDDGFQRVVSTAATKLLGSIAWGSRAFNGGIEDRYLVLLQPSLLRQLQPTLSFVTSANSQPLPANTYSATYYRFEDPALAWEGLKTSISSNVDALLAVVFSSLMKSALLSYGISDPEAFLRTVRGEVLTLRLDPNADHTMFIAGIRNRETLRALVTKTMKIQVQSQQREGTELFADAAGEMGVSFVDHIVILGTLADVRSYSENNRNDEEQVRRMTFFAPLSNSSPIVTYTDDSDRVRRFLSAIMAANGTPPEELVNLEHSIAKLPYAATETRLVDQRLERITRSPLGQFSTFLPLLIPDERRPNSLVLPAR